MRLSIIIPCYNESKTIAEVIKRVKNSPVEDKEIIVVDDCSNDGTAEILKNYDNSYKPDIPVKIFYHENNQGKGAAIKTGISFATGDAVVIQDADFEYNPDEYPNLMQPIIEGKADVVYGSRFSSGYAHRVLYFWHRLGNGFLTLLSNIFTNLNLTDMETGYKLFKREIIQSIKIEENRFGFEPEITAKISRIKGIRIYEIGISYNGRTYQEGKKIGWKDGFRAIYAIIKYGLLKKN